MSNEDKIKEFVKKSFAFPSIPNVLLKKLNTSTSSPGGSKKNAFKKTALEQMDTNLDELSSWINEQNKKKNRKFKKKNTSFSSLLSKEDIKNVLACKIHLPTNTSINAISPKYVGRAKSIFKVQNKFSLWWRFREELKKIYRFFGNLILKIRNVFRKLRGKDPLVLVPANRASVANHENAMPFQSFENLANPTKRHEICHQGYVTDLQRVLQSDNSKLAQEKLFLSNAPAFCTVNDDVRHDEKLFQAFQLIHQYLQKNPQISFAHLKNNHDLLKELSSDVGVQKRILEILYGKCRNAKHPLTNFASYMYAVSQNGDNPVFHHDILTKDCQLIAENKKPIYFLNEDGELVFFDPNDCLNKHEKRKAKILPERQKNGNELPQEVQSIDIHDELYKHTYKDKHGIAKEAVLTAALHGGFVTYGERQKQTPYHLLMYLGYQDNVNFKYDDEFPKAFAATRSAMQRLQMEDWCTKYSEEDWMVFEDLLQKMQFVGLPNAEIQYINNLHNNKYLESRLKDFEDEDLDNIQHDKLSSTKNSAKYSKLLELAKEISDDGLKIKNDQELKEFYDKLQDFDQESIKPCEESINYKGLFPKNLQNPDLDQYQPTEKIIQPSCEKLALWLPQLPINSQSFRIKCAKKIFNSQKYTKSSTLFNCMAGSNRSQLIMTQYVLSRFIENLYQDYQKQSEKTVDLDEFMQVVQNYVNENPYQTIFQMAVCVGLETQASQMSQFGFGNNAVMALKSEQGLSPLIHGIKGKMKDKLGLKDQNLVDHCNKYSFAEPLQSHFANVNPLNMLAASK